MQKTRFRRFLRSVLWRLQRIVTLLQNNLIYSSDGHDLNRALFSDVTQLDPQEVKWVQDKVRELSAARGESAESQTAWEGHTFRIILTMHWIEDAVRSMTGERVALDLGWESVTGDLWRLKFPNFQWQNTNWDLRFPWKYPEASADLIVCTELLEHLSDQANDTFNEGFYKGGLKAALRESLRVLKPGGYFIATTPNAASVIHLKAVLQGDPPWYFLKHVREYTLGEILAEIKEAGFSIVRARDIHCMSALAYSDFGPIFQLLLENGFSTNGRGDDLFVIAQKPKNSP